MNCKCCGSEDDRTRMGGTCCVSCFVLPLWQRQTKMEIQRRLSEAVEGYERPKAA